MLLFSDNMLGQKMANFIQNHNIKNQLMLALPIHMIAFVQNAGRVVSTLLTHAGQRVSLPSLNPCTRVPAPIVKMQRRRTASKTQRTRASTLPDTQ